MWMYSSERIFHSLDDSFYQWKGTFGSKALWVALELERYVVLCCANCCLLLYFSSINNQICTCVHKDCGIQFSTLNCFLLDFTGFIFCFWNVSDVSPKQELPNSPWNFILGTVVILLLGLKLAGAFLLWELYTLNKTSNTGERQKMAPTLRLMTFVQVLIEPQMGSVVTRGEGESWLVLCCFILLGSFYCFILQFWLYWVFYLEITSTIILEMHCEHRMILPASTPDHWVYQRQSTLTGRSSPMSQVVVFLPSDSFKTGDCGYWSWEPFACQKLLSFWALVPPCKTDASFIYLDGFNATSP